jgi:hypothetical protein
MSLLNEFLIASRVEAAQDGSSEVGSAPAIAGRFRMERLRTQGVYRS